MPGHNSGREPTPGSVVQGTSSYAIFSGIILFQRSETFSGLLKDLALQLSIIISSDTSVPGFMVFHLPWTSVSPFSFGWLRMFTHLQHSPWASPPGNCPWLPRLGWVLFFGPSSHLCCSTQLQNSCVSGARSLHGYCVKSASCIPFRPLSLPSLHLCLSPCLCSPPSLYHSSTCIPLSFYLPA